MLGHAKFAVRVTHKTTGISATRDSNYFRTPRAAYDSCIKYIKSRIYMLGNPPMKENELKFEEIKDGEQNAN